MTTGQTLRVRIICLAQGAYAAINTPTRSHDALLPSGKSAINGLLDLMKEQKAKAQRHMETAKLYMLAVQALRAAEKESHPLQPTDATLTITH
jgi:hypothetical protein